MMDRDISKKAWDELFSGHVTAIIIAILGFAISVFLTFFSAKISSAANNDLYFKIPFYFAVLAFVLLIVMREFAVGKTNKILQGKINDAIQTLSDNRKTLVDTQEALKSVPSLGVLKTCYGILQQNNDDLIHIQKYKDKKQVIESIKSCLLSIIEIAQKLTTKNLHFGANLMILKEFDKPITSVELDEIWKEIEPYCSFNNRNSIKTELKGVLVLKKEFSVNSQSEYDEATDTISIDSTLEKLKLILPVPQSPYDTNNKRQYHPGAVAATFQSFHLIHNTKNIINDYSLGKAAEMWSPNITNGLEHDQMFYSQLNGVRRVLSINCGKNVLNIHVSDSEALNHHWKLYALLTLITPINEAIVRLFKHYEDMKQ